jgi:TPR repeat protein
MRPLFAFVAATALLFGAVDSPAWAVAGGAPSEDEASLQQSTEQCLLEKPDDGTVYCMQAAIEAALLYADKCEAKDFDTCVKYADNQMTTNETRGDFTPIGVILEDGCNALHAESCAALGSVFTSGWRGNSVLDLAPGLEIDFKNARFFADKGCTLGSVLGCALMGVMSHNGDGAEQNLDEARRFFAKACEMGDDDSCAYGEMLKAESAGQ